MSAPATVTLPQAVIAAYGWQQASYIAAPCGNGHINQTLSVQVMLPTAAPLDVIVQRINTHIFTDPTRLMDNISRVTAHLRQQIQRDGGDPEREALRIIPTTNGALYTMDEQGNAWRCYVRVPDAVTPPTVPTAAQMEEAGRGYGRFLYALRYFSVDSLFEVIPRFHDTPHRLAALRDAVRRDPCGRAHTVQPELAFCLQRADDCARLTDAHRRGELPLRVTHNDTKLNNLLLDIHTGRSVCVLDLDTVMPGLAAYDFGDAIRSGCTTAAEDHADLSQVQFNATYYAAYLKGYLETAGTVLTAAERESLPWGARIMTLECGIRFLTDYINGDIYFAIHHPTHNLDRCRNQLKLVSDMERSFDDMCALTRGGK